jgi:hypothetical protein
MASGGPAGCQNCPVRILRARLAPGQRILLVIVIGAVLGLGGFYLAISASLNAWVPFWGSAGLVAFDPPGAGPGWAGLVILLVVIAAWLSLSVPLLASPPGAGRPGSRLARLGDGQRAALVIGLGAGLAVLGAAGNQLASGPAVTTSFATFGYAPTTGGFFYGPPAPGFLPGWAHALIWLAVLAAWALLSWRLLGRRPAAPPAAVPESQP